MKWTASFTVPQALGNDVVLHDWIVKRFPIDIHSIENAPIITSNGHSPPLLIDPQLSGTKWLWVIKGETFIVVGCDPTALLQ
jgi:hypothetical protein